MEFWFVDPLSRRLYEIGEESGYVELERELEVAHLTNMSLKDEGGEIGKRMPELSFFTREKWEKTKGEAWRKILKSLPTKLRACFTR